MIIIGKLYPFNGIIYVFDYVTNEHFLLFTTRFNGGICVYWLSISPCFVNCKECNPGYKLLRAAIRKYAVDFPNYIWNEPAGVKKSVFA